VPGGLPAAASSVPEHAAERKWPAGGHFQEAHCNAAHKNVRSIATLFAANDDIITTPFPDGDLTTIAAMVLPIFPIAVAIGANLDPHLGEFHAWIRLGDGKSGDWRDRGKAGGRHNNQCKFPHDVPPHNGRRTNAASRLSFQFDANTPHIFRNNVPETTAWAFSKIETASAVSQSY
jgi:hypothetical protein